MIHDRLIVLSFCAVLALSGCAAPQLATTELRSDASPGPTVAPPVAATPVATVHPAQPPRIELARVLIYTADLNLVVANVNYTLQIIRQTAESAGGYLAEMDASGISIRIPAARFHSVLADVEKLGEVTSRRVKASDVTEELRDLKIRLENAEQMRQRLVQLLEKSGKMEDALKVEAELERITQTIELLKGKIQYLQSQAAFSTIHVKLNASVPQSQIAMQIPFEWVRRLGEDMLSGSAISCANARPKSHENVAFDLPKSYLRYFDREGLTQAMSAQGVFIKIQRQDNFDGGDADFWAVLARRVLVENRGLAVEEIRDMPMSRGKLKARVLTGTRDLGGKQQAYVLALVPTRHRVYAYEAWGPKEPLTTDRPAIEKSVVSMDVDP